MSLQKLQDSRARRVRGVIVRICSTLLLDVVVIIRARLHWGSSRSHRRRRRRRYGSTVSGYVYRLPSPVAVSFNLQPVDPSGYPIHAGVYDIRRRRRIRLVPHRVMVPVRRTFWRNLPD